MDFLRGIVEKPRLFDSKEQPAVAAAKVQKRPPAPPQQPAQRLGDFHVRKPKVIVLLQIDVRCAVVQHSIAFIVEQLAEVENSIFFEDSPVYEFEMFFKVFPEPLLAIPLRRSQGVVEFR